MLINLSDIMTINGNIFESKIPIEMNNFKLNGIEYEFKTKNPLELIITYKGKKKLIIEGKTKISLMIPCSRCLKDVEVAFNINIYKHIDFNSVNIDDIEELKESSYIKGYDLDVDCLVYEEILIDFPLKVLCKEDCKGICEVCGINLNEGSCDCEKKSLDPRMSVIQDIFKNFNQTK